MHSRRSGIGWRLRDGARRRRTESTVNSKPHIITSVHLGSLIDWLLSVEASRFCIWCLEQFELHCASIRVSGLLFVARPHAYMESALDAPEANSSIMCINLSCFYINEKSF